MLLAAVIDGYRATDAAHGDLISILMRARADETGADVHPVISSTLVPSDLPVTVTRRP